MIESLSLLGFCWLTTMAVLSARRIALGDVQTAHFCIALHWLLCGLPLLLDVIVRQPHYIGRMFETAASDPETRLVYLAYVCIIPLILRYSGTVRGSALAGDQPDGNTANELPSHEASRITRVRTGLVYAGVIILMASPPVFAMFAPIPSLYLHYGSVIDLEYLSSRIVFFHSLVATMCLLSMIVAVLIVRRADSTMRALVFTLPFVLIDSFLYGKRILPAMYLVLLMRVLWDKGHLRGPRLYVVLGTISVLFLSFNLWYQSAVRGIQFLSNKQTSISVYDNYRLDYCRDHTIKLAIYAELTNRPVLEYRGQSLLFYAGMYIPRIYWESKPYPYPYRLTEYGIGAPYNSIRWSFTTSIFDEGILNFSFLGMLLAPFVLARMCRFGDANLDPMLRILSVIVCLLFMTVCLSTFFPVFLFWLVGSFINQHRRFFRAKPNRFSRYASG